VLDGEEGQRRWGEVVKKVGGGLPPINDLSHAPKLEALRWATWGMGDGLALTPGNSCWIAVSVYPRSRRAPTKCRSIACSSSASFARCST
jgi:hypothetical protein